LEHWKEREPGFRARRARILERLGYVPAYATAEQGGPVDIAPKERARRRISTPAGQEVSQSEFEQMVRDLGVEEAEARRQARHPAATGAPRTTGGRRARNRASGGAEAAPAPPPADAPGTDPPKERKPRNRRHGRPR